MKEQVIYTNPARSKYEYVEDGREMYNRDLMVFVNHELNECMKKAYPGIAELRYVEDMVELSPDGRDYRYKQAVIIAFENGYRKIANVEGDSEWGCIEDVMKCVER